MNEDDAATVRMIYNYYMAGMSLAEIASRLNVEGIRLPQWSRKSGTPKPA